MKRYRLNQLPDVTEGHFLKGIIPGQYSPGLALLRSPTCAPTPMMGRRQRLASMRTLQFHPLQGKAVMEVNGERIPMVTGDVFVIEPGEDHHLIPDADPASASGSTYLTGTGST